MTTKMPQTLVRAKKVSLHSFNYLQRLYRLSHIAVAPISVKACDEI